MVLVISISNFFFNEIFREGIWVWFSCSKLAFGWGSEILENTEVWGSERTEILNPENFISCHPREILKIICTIIEVRELFYFLVSGNILKIPNFNNSANYFQFLLDATHSANFNEKVHKHQSKSYCRIGANMQLIFTYILWIWILLSLHHNFLEFEGLALMH